MNEKLPSISVIIPTYNASKTIFSCLRSIHNQNYPEKIIEIIVVDGGSQDDTIAIAKSFGARIVSVPVHIQTAEYNKATGVLAAKNKLLLFLDADNILPHKNWLQKMVYPILAHNDVVGVSTLYLHYDRKFSLIDRYVSLFGSLDTVAYYIGNVDRLSRVSQKYTLYGSATKYKDYYITIFSPPRIPTLGSNGFLIGRKLLIQHAFVGPKYFSHTDVNVDLIKKGYNKYAFIKDDIIHLTGSRGFLDFLKRRKKFMEVNMLGRLKVKRYSVVQSHNIVDLLKYILYTVTFIKPFYDSLRGYMKIRDRAWFLHPVLCYLLLIIYGYTLIRFFIKKTIGS